MREKLSHAEKKVFDLIVKGLENKQIARSLFVCDSTVKFHITNIYKKTGMKNRAELLAKYETGR